MKVEPPKIKMPEVKLPEPPKPPEIKMVQQPPIALPAPPKLVQPPPAPKIVNLAQALPAAVANNSPHPTAVALGQHEQSHCSLQSPRDHCDQPWQQRHGWNARVQQGHGPDHMSVLVPAHPPART